MCRGDAGGSCCSETAQTPHTDTGESAAVALGRSCLLAVTTSWLFLILEASATLPSSAAVSLPPSCRGKEALIVVLHFLKSALRKSASWKLWLVQHLKIKDDLELKQTALISKDHTSTEICSCARGLLWVPHIKQAQEPAVALSLTWVHICVWDCVCAQRVGAGVQDVLISRLFQACGCFFFLKPIKLKEGHPLQQFLGFQTSFHRNLIGCKHKTPNAVFFYYDYSKWFAEFIDVWLFTRSEGQCDIVAL